MADGGKNPLVDEFIGKAKAWREELEALRRIALMCPLTEEVKWGKPCYTFQNHNVMIIHGFKEYCAILFIKGALLRDAHGILIQQTENVQAARQIRFTDVQEITDQQAIIKEYILEAIELEKAGLEVELKKPAEYAIPQELQSKFEASPDFKTAFEALTPGRQRAYLLHFSEPKQSATRTARIEKCMPQIFAGKGLNEYNKGR